LDQGEKHSFAVNKINPEVIFTFFSLHSVENSALNAAVKTCKFVNNTGAINVRGETLKTRFTI